MSKHPQAYRTRSGVILGLLCLTYLFDYADRMVIGSVIPLIKQDWGLSDRALGSLTSVVYLSIALFVIPLSLLVDRWSRRRMIALMVFFWSLATLACAFARNYTQLLAARAMLGLGEAGYAPAGTAALSAAYPREVRARALGIWNAFIPIGAALGFLVGGYIGAHYGWRRAFGLVALPGMLLAVLFLFTRDYRTVPLEEEGVGEEGQPPGLGSHAVGLLRIPTLWYAYLAFAMNSAVTTALMTWLPSYFHRFQGLDQDHAGTVAAGVVLLVLVGAPLGGIVSDRWMQTRQNARMVFSGITSLASAGLLVLALLVAQTWALWPVLVAFGVMTTCYVAPTAAVTQDVVHPGLRALAMGGCVICQHLLGGAWSPMIIGRLSDSLGLEKALFLLPAFGVVAAGLLLWGARAYEKDLARVKHVELLAE
jgi:MFS family permease